MNAANGHYHFSGLVKNTLHEIKYTPIFIAIGFWDTVTAQNVKAENSEMISEQWSDS